MTAAESAPLNDSPEPLSFAEPRLLTVSEYLEIGELPSGYSELSEGRVMVVPSAIVDHNYAGCEMRDQIKPQLPADLFCIYDMDVNLELAPPDEPGFCRRPDLLVVERAARERVRREGGVLRASEVRIAIEIISRGSRRTDTVVKRDEYADAGIPHYWVLDLTTPVSLLVMHSAGELGYAVTGEFTGRVTLAEPFPLRLDLDALL